MKKGILLSFCLIHLFPSLILASPTTHLKSGDKTAEEFLSQLEAKKIEAGHHPFYAGHSMRLNLKTVILMDGLKVLIILTQSVKCFIRALTLALNLELIPQKIL